ncbi:MAG: YitT family protein [Myxococcales bacterium]|jgi:uncharacterized membrane-anchored protein YitT (DUF2179 family)
MPRFYGKLAATLVGSVAINAPLVPANMFSPGASGTGLLVHYLTGWPLGAIHALLNLPIFVIGWREYALEYVVISAVGVLMYAAANVVNGLNLLGALLIFDLGTCFYSALLMWVSAATMQWFQTGITQHRAVFVITRHHRDMTEAIRHRLRTWEQEGYRPRRPGAGSGARR